MNTPDWLGRVGVVGCGVMGTGVAELCAVRGLDVVVHGRRETSTDSARERLAASLDRGVRKGRMTEADRKEALSRTTFTTDLDTLHDCRIVVECAPEREPLKRELFAALDRIVTDPDAVLASVTSSIPITRLARATSRPAKVIGTHLFNPAPAMPLAELVPTLLTDDETVRRAEEFLRDTLGKQVIRAPDRAGFLVNTLLVPYLLSAIRMVETGVAPAVDIDRAMAGGCGHPMGPLALVDLIGLDVIAETANSLYDEYKEPLYAPPPLLSRMVEAGMLGKKTGTGFHDYRG
ncbi:MAG TPA: 3-hydroxybutyryl-CoA dehydrogenase [Streptomyces sp.]